MAIGKPVKSMARPSSKPVAKTSAKAKDKPEFSASNNEGPGHSGPSSPMEVIVRCRARDSKEEAEHAKVAVSIDTAENAVIVDSKSKVFKISRAFGAECDQQMLFDDVVAPLVDGYLLNGMNTTIFAYGQTGTGKTYTMTGDLPDSDCTRLPDSAGLIPRIIFQLFEKLSGKHEYLVQCSFVEIYNEVINDLLVGSNGSAAASGPAGAGTASSGMAKQPNMPPGRPRLSRPAPSSSALEPVSNGTVVSVPSAISAINLLRTAISRRQVAQTKMNNQSSRSHTIFTITVSTTCPGDGATNGSMIQQAKLNLADLAGSENISRAGNADSKVRARETANINQSLLALGRVINALTDSKTTHIPYRESKLTRLLQDSLGGSTKTCLIATISPAASNLEETMSTLEYASRACRIESHLAPNAMFSRSVLFQDLVRERDVMSRDLKASQQKNGIYLEPSRYQEMVNELNSLQVLSKDTVNRRDVAERQLAQARDEVEEMKRLVCQLKEENMDMSLSLKLSEKELHEIKEQLNSERTLSQAHAGSETTLHSIALSLVDKLDCASNDIHDLHSRLMVSSVACQKIKKDVAQQKRALGGGQKSIADLKNKLTVAIDTVKEHARVALEETLVKLDNVEIARQDLAKSREQTVEIHNNFAKTMEGVLEDYHSKICAKVDHLCAGLESFTGDVKQQSERWMTDVVAADKAMLEIVGKLADCLEHERHLLHSVLPGINDGLTTIEKRSERSKALLMKNIEKLVTDFHEAQRNEVRNFMDIKIKQTIEQASSRNQEHMSHAMLFAKEWTANRGNRLDTINRSGKETTRRSKDLKANSENLKIESLDGKILAMNSTAQAQSDVNAAFHNVDKLAMAVSEGRELLVSSMHPTAVLELMQNTVTEKVDQLKNHLLSIEDAAMHIGDLGDVEVPPKNEYRLEQSLPELTEGKSAETRKSQEPSDQLVSESLSGFSNSEVTSPHKRQPLGTLTNESDESYKGRRMERSERAIKRAKLN